MSPDFIMTANKPSTNISPSNDYEIPAAHTTIEYEIKKSRFIAWACPVSDRSAAMQWLNQAQTAYPDARHHCWAYQIGSPRSPSTAAMSDDGEPNGTAGKPILNVLHHKDVGDIMVIVIRYFGGIKLGAGGLVRAYSQATQMAMDALETTTKVALVHYEVECQFHTENSLRQWLDSHQGTLSSMSYSNKCHARCSLPVKKKTLWESYCTRENIRFGAASVTHKKD